MEVKTRSWDQDETYHQVIGSIPFLLHIVDEDVICCGKADNGRIVPLTREEKAVALNLHFIVDGRREESSSEGKTEEKYVWPYLTPQEMKTTTIDFMKGYVLDTQHLNYIDRNTLHMVGRALSLDTSNVETLKAMIMKLGQGFNWSAFYHEQPAPPNLPDIILIHKVERRGETSIWWVQGGYITVLEVRNNEGMLIRREFHDKDNTRYHLYESWMESGLLRNRCYYDNEGEPIGPYYKRERKSAGVIMYNLHGTRVDRKVWDEYIVKSVMDATSLLNDLCALVIDYVAF